MEIGGKSNKNNILCYKNVTSEFTQWVDKPKIQIILYIYPSDVNQCTAISLAQLTRLQPFKTLHEVFHFKF